MSVIPLWFGRPIPAKSWPDPCDRERYQHWQQDLPSCWQAASSLLGTVVSRYAPHESCGAYTVWLLHQPNGK